LLSLQRKFDKEERQRRGEEEREKERERESGEEDGIRNS
jgi:hypothetical protein